MIFIKRNFFNLLAIGFFIFILIEPNFLCFSANIVVGNIVKITNFSLPYQLYFSIFFLFFFLIFEGIRKNTAIYDAFYKNSYSGNTLNLLRSIWKEGAFAILILLYFISTFQTAFLNVEAIPKNWSACSSRFSLMIDVFSLWVVSFSIIEIFLLFVIFVRSIIFGRQ